MLVNATSTPSAMSTTVISCAVTFVVDSSMATIEPYGVGLDAANGFRSQPSEKP